jgi:hypothetical protein
VQTRGSQAGEILHIENDDIFGDNIKIKKPNSLRIGFQNIGGFPLLRNKYKNDIIRSGITQWDAEGYIVKTLHWYKTL